MFQLSLSLKALKMIEFRIQFPNYRHFSRYPEKMDCLSLKIKLYHHNQNYEENHKFVPEKTYFFDMNQSTVYKI